MSALPRIRPMRLRRAKEPFDNPDYIFELKHDGFRALAYIESGKCRLVSRNLKTLRFESLCTALDPCTPRAIYLRFLTPLGRRRKWKVRHAVCLSFRLIPQRTDLL